MKTCTHKDKECPHNYNVDKCTKYQDCEHDEIELERLRAENEKLKEQLKASHFSNVIPSSETLRTALIEIAMILDSGEMNVNSQDFKLWKIANDALKSQK